MTPPRLQRRSERLTARTRKAPGSRPLRPARSGVVGTAEISLIVSVVAATASVGAVVITYRLGRQRFEHERRLSDLDAVRRVLDDASAAMRHMESAGAGAIGHLDYYAEQSPGQIRDNPTAVEDLATLTAARDDLGSLAGRLQIRFGSEHELVTVYEAAAGAALGVTYLVGLIIREYVCPPAVAVDTHREKIEGAIGEFALGRQSFNLIAYRVAGVELPAAQLHEMAA
jgi:hypothetical protein